MLRRLLKNQEVRKQRNKLGEPFIFEKIIFR
jgi:hypothetical protein